MIDEWIGHSDRRAGRRPRSRIVLLRRARSVALAGTLVLLRLSAAHVARAACNLIPQTTRTFDGSIGSANRPFAAPNETVDLRVRPCDTGSTAAPGGFNGSPGSYRVTVIFTPPSHNHDAVILSTDCTGLASACQSQLTQGGTAQCLTVTAGTGQPLDIVTLDDGPHLRVRFPDTTGLFIPGVLAGPATIVVTKAADPLVCDLDAKPCRGHSGLAACVDDFFTNDGACGTLAAAQPFSHFTALPPANSYVADCFSASPPCNPTAPAVQATADNQGNLLVPMDWTGILIRQADEPVPRLLTMTVAPPIDVKLPGKSFLASYTPEGGLLPPLFEPQFDPHLPPTALTLFGSADAPYTVLRIARRSETLQQCSGGFNDGGPCNSDSECPGACANDATRRCKVDTDCVASVCGAAGTCGPATCSNNPSQLCNTDGNCPGGECGPTLVPQSSLQLLVDSGIGAIRLARFGPFTPILDPGICQLDTTAMCTANGDCSAGSSAPCVRYAMQAQDPVPLEGLAQSQDLLALTVNELIDHKDRNGDNDFRDTAVVTLRDRTTGIQQDIPATAGCSFLGAAHGRAVVSLHQAPFTFPAVTAEGDVLAFLESELDQNAFGLGGCDENGDGDTFDAILRVFRLGPTELTSGARVADPALLINGHSLAMSDGIVFYRHSEGGESHGATERVSVATNGTQGDQNSPDTSTLSPNMSLSADGRYVAFVSRATTLVAGDGNGVSDIFVRDRCVSNSHAISGCSPTTTRASVSSTGAQSSNRSGSASISADGRFVAFYSDATNLVLNDTNNAADAFVRDRCISNGVSVSGCQTSTERVSVSSMGAQASIAQFTSVSISGDGTAVGFISTATNLAPNATNGHRHVFVRDRAAGTTELVSADDNGVQGNADSFALGLNDTAISADGRFVAFSNNSTNLVPNDTNGAADLFVRDRCVSSGVAIAGCTPSTERVSVDSAGVQANLGASSVPSISADGRFVAFQSNARNLVPNVTAGIPEIFVHDRLTGTTELVSADSIGTAINSSYILPAISGDGRFVAMNVAGNSGLLYLDGSTRKIIVHDRVTGLNAPASVDSSGFFANGDSGIIQGAAFSGISISFDGRSVAFSSSATGLVPGDTNGVEDVFVHSVNPSGTGDITGDGDHDDAVLEALDSSTSPPSTITALCPAGLVSVAGGNAAFLRPEAAGPAPSLETSGSGIAGCPTGTSVAGSVSLNGDTDATDDVVHFWPGTGPVQNLGKAATAVALSAVCAGGTNAGLGCKVNSDCPGSTCVPKWVAALVSETDENSPDSAGADLNNDQDTDDDVVEVHTVASAPTAWSNVKQAADVLQAVGPLVAFTTPEAAQNQDLNGDGDQDDRVLQIYDAAAHKLTNTGQAAEEFVVGNQTVSCGTSPLVAFRTREAAQGNTDLNNVGQNGGAGDGDMSDFVLQVYANGLGVVSTHQAAIPCALDACDPQVPYRVEGDTVKFLTVEAQQDQDLNGKNGMNDLILQIFNACTGTLTVVGPVDPTSPNPLGPGPAAPSPGKRCMRVVPPNTCGTDSDCTAVTPGAFCSAGSCLLPTTFPATCNADADCPSGSSCQSDQIIAVINPPPAHDSVVVPHRPVTVTIPQGMPSVDTTLTVRVRNADILPKSEKPGHRVRLVAEDGDCPQGTVGIADLSKKTAGIQDNVLLAGGKAAKAVIPLHFAAANFNTPNPEAPKRCTLLLHATTVLAGNVDPNSGNDVLPVEINVVDANDALQATPQEVLVRSAKPTKLRITSTAQTKTLKATVVNGDTVARSITVTANNGNCPPATIGTISPSSVMVPPGASRTVAIPITVQSADFASPNKKTPGRCIATLTAIGGVAPGSEPDPSNNVTDLVIDVIDKSDL